MAAQLKVGAPLRSRVESDVIAPGRVALARWALAEGWARPWARGPNDAGPIPAQELDRGPVPRVSTRPLALHGGPSPAGRGRVDRPATAELPRNNTDLSSIFYIQHHSRVSALVVRETMAFASA